MEQKEYLESLGIAVDEALGRFMNNEALFMKIIKKFPSDPNFSQLKAALAAGDVNAAYTAAHTLKGVAGNLSIKTLFEKTSDVVEELRAENLQGAVAKMPALEEQYNLVVNGLFRIQ